MTPCTLVYKYRRFVIHQCRHLQCSPSSSALRRSNLARNVAAYIPVFTVLCPVSCNFEGSSRLRCDAASLGIMFPTFRQDVSISYSRIEWCVVHIIILHGPFYPWRRRKYIYSKCSERHTCEAVLQTTAKLHSTATRTLTVDSKRHEPHCENVTSG